MNVSVGDADVHDTEQLSALWNWSDDVVEEENSLHLDQEKVVGVS